MEKNLEGDCKGLVEDYFCDRMEILRKTTIIPSTVSAGSETFE